MNNNLNIFNNNVIPIINIHSLATQFNELFSKAFKIDSFPIKYQTTAKAAISNLIGSISFFIGDTIQKTQDHSLIHTPKGTLYTAIPGRSFFPRGFIWDEGFHQLVISEWNHTLSMEIVRSWMNRIEPSVVDISLFLLNRVI